MLMRPSKAKKENCISINYGEIAVWDEDGEVIDLCDVETLGPDQVEILYKWLIRKGVL
jgi:hypothetical protein